MKFELILSKKSNRVRKLVKRQGNPPLALERSLVSQLRALLLPILRETCSLNVNQKMELSDEDGNYAKTITKGDLIKAWFVSKWSAIWKMDFDRVFTADFEVFRKKAQNPNNAKIAFFIEVK